MQRRFEIVGELVLQCDQSCQGSENRFSPQPDQTRPDQPGVTRVSVKKLKLPKRARILPQHPKSSELLDRSRRFSHAAHLQSTTSRWPFLSCGYQAQQTLGNKLRPKAKGDPYQTESKRRHRIPQRRRGCGDDKVLGPHPIGHRPALLPVHLQTGSCLITTVGLLFESRQNWDCWGAPKRARARAPRRSSFIYGRFTAVFSSATIQILPFSLCSMPNLSWRALLGRPLVFALGELHPQSSTQSRSHSAAIPCMHTCTDHSPSRRSLLYPCMACANGGSKRS